jgi:two-component system, LytTR family, response regulator
MRIKSIIVDDEKHGRENLSGILREYCPEVELLGEAASVEAVLTLIREQSPDLVFLDIEMPRANGFQLLEHLQDFSFEVIFVTAFDNYAIKAIRFSAADYILKPINRNDLKSAVEKVAGRIREKQENHRMKQLYHNLSQPGNPRIGLPAGDRIEYTDVSKIVRCQGEGNYTHIWFSDGKHLLVAKTLVEFEDLLQEFGFVRVHKTPLVNLNYVVS